MDPGRPPHAADDAGPVRATSRRPRRRSRAACEPLGDRRRRPTTSARPSRALGGAGTGPSVGGHGPHRRDRPDRHPHRRQRLPVVHSGRRLGPADPRRPARGACSRATGASPASRAASRSTCSTEDERKAVPKLKDLHIDIGAKDGDEARSMARVGDVAVIAAEPVELPNGRIVSRSMDNRVGCFVAYETLRLLAEGDAPARRLLRGRGQPRGDELPGRGARPPYALAARRGDRHRRHARDRRARRRREGERPPPLRRGPGDRARRDAVPARVRRGSSTRPRRRASRTRSRRRAARRGRTPTRSSRAAPASPRRPSACPAATCTRRSRWWSSTTCSTPPRLCAAFVRSASAA